MKKKKKKKKRLLTFPTWLPLQLSHWAFFAFSFLLAKWIPFIQILFFFFFSFLVMPILLLFQMDLDEDTAEKFYQKLLKLEKQIRVTIQKTNNRNWKWCSLKHIVPFVDSGVCGFLLSWTMCICGKKWFLMISSLQNHLYDCVCVCVWEKNIWYFIKVMLESPNWVSVC